MVDPGTKRARISFLPVSLLFLTSLTHQIWRFRRYVLPKRQSFCLKHCSVSQINLIPTSNNLFNCDSISITWSPSLSLFLFCYTSSLFSTSHHSSVLISSLHSQVQFIPQLTCNPSLLTEFLPSSLSLFISLHSFLSILDDFHPSVYLLVLSYFRLLVCARFFITSLVSFSVLVRHFD
jgi:hypothetical protein